MYALNKFISVFLSQYLNNSYFFIVLVCSILLLLIVSYRYLPQSLVLVRPLSGFVVFYIFRCFVHRNHFTYLAYFSYNATGTEIISGVHSSEIIYHCLCTHQNFICTDYDTIISSLSTSLHSAQTHRFVMIINFLVLRSTHYVKWRAVILHSVLKIL